MPHPYEATRYVVDLSAGRQKAAEDLLPLVYNQLHEIAEQYMKHERADHILQPTALVNEAYVRLVDDSQVDWRGRTHFMAVAARAMQRVLLDQARSRDRQKRGGPGVAGRNDENEKSWRRVELNDAFALTDHDRLDVLALEDALAKMRRIDERQARIAELRLFSEMNDEQIAAMLDVSERTVERDWKVARAWLRRELGTRQ
jgi:RNA polymerase sigma factor (TIGR02999 family)